MTIKKALKATVENCGKKTNQNKMYSFVMTMACASVCLFMMDYLLWRLDLKGVTLEKVHNNLAKTHLNKY